MNGGGNGIAGKFSLNENDGNLSENVHGFASKAGAVKAASAIGPFGALTHGFAMPEFVSRFHVKPTSVLKSGNPNTRHEPGRV